MVDVHGPKNIGKKKVMVLNPADTSCVVQVSIWNPACEKIERQLQEKYDASPDGKFLKIQFIGLNIVKVQENPKWER